MRLLVFILLFCIPSGLTAGTTYTQSGQFTVSIASAPVATRKSGEQPGLLRLEPEFLAISAERIKAAFLRELQLQDRWNDSIKLLLLENAGAAQGITIVSTHYRDGWSYQVGIPAQVEETRLVEALVQVLLLEFANRQSARATEVPRWLVTGLTEKLLSGIGAGFVVGPKALAWEMTSKDSLSNARQCLMTNSPPTFTDLTLTAQNLPETVYRCGSHLLVSELSSSNDQLARLKNFIQLLPRTWNWQTAFLQSFGFRRMLDVEKWWALSLVEFTTRDQRQAWPIHVSLSRLQEALLTPLEIQAKTNALPEIKYLSLQELLTEEKLPARQDLIEFKISQLQLWSVNLAPEVADLMVDYKQVLEKHLVAASRAGVSPGLRTIGNREAELVLKQTLRHLDALDKKRKEASKNLGLPEQPLLGRR
ncbi:MAG: hypothetical protein SFY81_10905 [Verrucomicrobiota bacterium]|nr:hypothetical protein [Verrucomicrobiota bacterium]